MRVVQRLFLAGLIVAVTGVAPPDAHAQGAAPVSASDAHALSLERRLIDAVKRSDAATVESLLAAGASVGASEGDESTALHWASYTDDLDSAGLLLAAGAAVDAANDLGATPLWTASQNGSAAMVGRLLAAGADPNAPLLAGETPLMVGARSGSAPVVEQLLAVGADPHARGARGQTALMWSVAQHHADVTEVLIAGGADVHARSDVWTQVMAVPPHGQFGYNQEFPHGGNTALLFAARVGDLASARLLVSGGADVDDVNAWGVSATVLAAHSGYADVVDYLLEQGADPNAAGAGFAALHAAVMRGDEHTATALLAHGAEPDPRLETWTPTRRASRDHNFAPALVGATPFWLAARLGRVTLMRLLADHGADPLFVHHADYIADGSFERRIEATTALMAAVGMGGGRRVRPWGPLPDGSPEMRALEAVTLAVELGVDVNAADTDSRTALDGAEGLQYESVVRFLVANGATPGL